MMIKKFGAALATSAMLLTAVSPVSAVTPKVEKSTSYTDVPSDYTHYTAILEARYLGMLSGYGDDTFKPYQALTRANVVKALGKYVVEKSGKEIEDLDLTEVEPFKDVQPDYPDDELYTYSLIVKQAGIFQGSNNNLMPTSLIQRQQMAQVLVNAFGLEDLSDKESSVKDNGKAWKDFRESIDVLSVNGVTTVENFRPDESTTRGQFASFLVRAYKVSEGLNPKAPYPSAVESVHTLPDIMITVGETPELPKTVGVTLESGVDTSRDVEWNTNNFITDKAGNYTFEGNVKDTELLASIEVIVKEPTYKEPSGFGVVDNVIYIHYPAEMGASALDLTNYKFNGGAFPSGTTISGEGRVYQITLPKLPDRIPEDIDNTLEITQNVKTADGNIIVYNSIAANNGTEEPETVITTISFHDNVPPTLVSAHYVISSADSSITDQIQLTFSEKISPTYAEVPGHIHPSEWHYWEEQISFRLQNLEDDFLLKVDGAEVYSSFNRTDGEMIYISIPPMDISQNSSITIVPQGVDNLYLMITDDSKGENAVVAPVTKTITKNDIVVINPEKAID